MVDISTIVHVGAGAVAGAGLSLNDAWQAVVGDRIAAWRLSNAIKLQAKVQAELGTGGLQLNPTKVPDRYAFAWFEEATKQDEDEIQELFAKLLAQAASGNTEAADRRHLNILTQLTPDDAATFKAIYATAPWHISRLQPDRVHHWGFGHLHRVAKAAVGTGGQKALEHLLNVGLLSQSYQLDKNTIAGAVSYSLSRGRVPDLSQIEIKENATSTAIGVSLYLGLYPDTLAQFGSNPLRP